MGHRQQQAAAGVAALVLALVLVATWAPCAQAVCTTEHQVALSLAFSTNRTGHPHLDARLEQPHESPAWQLDVELGTSACEAGTRRKVVALTLNGSPWNKVVPAGYTLLPGLGHYRRPDVALNWTDAKDLCAQEGAVLAVPATKNEFDTLQRTFPNPANQVWFGASDIEVEGKWKTVAGVPLAEVTNLPWNGGQPNEGTSANCARYDVGYGLYDQQCYSKYTFFCKA